MCEDEVTAPVGARERFVFGRRALLQGAALSALSGTLVGNFVWPRRAAAASVDGAYSMAMHIHTSFSELYGSMDGHLQQAEATGTDVIWWTDHDTKMNGVHDRKVVHFTSLTRESGDGSPWNWTLQRTGSLSTVSAGGIARKPASPRDPIPAGSLQLTAQGTDSEPASLGFSPVADGGQQNWRTNLTGQTLALEVLPISVSPAAYLEFRIASSYHPAAAGRPAGQYTLSYRFAGTGPPSRRASGLEAIITVPCRPDAWNSVVLRPDRDLAALFPDLDSRDFSLYELSLNAVSTGGAKASGYVDYMRFSRATTGDVALAVHDDMMTSYQRRYPSVAQRRGIEVSHGVPHLNWFGGSISLPVYTGVPRSEYHDFLRQTVVPEIHNSGGLVSYNHPCGTSSPRIPLPADEQDALLRDAAVELIAENALDTDIMEVGYPLRAGVDIDHHTGLWDVCSRNAIFLTGNGVTDDHTGDDWINRTNDWTTSVWADASSEATLLAALRGGRAWCGSISDHQGALDLLVDNTCPMGSVSVSGLSGRTMTVSATGVPSGGSLEIVQGAVDFAGTPDPVPSARVVQTLPATAFADGALDIRVDTGESCFVRSQVRDSSGAVIALSNPVWLLREGLPGGREIPAARGC